MVHGSGIPKVATACPRIAVFNQKGGVGKTATVLNLGAASGCRQEAALLIDLDPQAHLTRTCGEPPRKVEESLFAFYQDARPLQEIETDWQEVGGLIRAHQQLIKVESVYGRGPAVLNRLKGGLEALERKVEPRLTLLDCPPYVGVLSLNAIFAADWVLIPVASDFLSLDAALQATRTLRALEHVLKRRVPRRYLLCRFDRRRRMTFQVREKALAEFGDEVCETVISENVAVAESPFHKTDVFRHSASGAGARDYAALWEELRSGGLL